MQNEAVYSDFINIISTKHDLNILLAEIDMLSAALFKTNEKAFNETLENKVRKKVADIILFRVEKGADKKSLLSELNSWARSVPIIELTIAFEPTVKVVERVSQWVRMNVGEAVIDYKIDRRIMGGAVIVFKGKIIDCSLIKKI